MSKITLVNVTHVEESRVAVVEDGVLAGYEIETLNRANIKGNIYNAIVESVHPSLEAAFVRIGPDLKGFLPLDEVNFKLLPVRTDSRKNGRIGQHLSQGQKLMVQVVREPFAGKPPTISTYFSLPGRFLVLMPGVDSAGISRKIESAAQRDRLKKIVDELRAPEGFGVIVRTAGVGQTKTELQRDLRYLLRLWESIQRSSAATEFPGQVYSEADLVIRTIRDHFTPDTKEVWIDSEETYNRALAFMRDVMPTKAKVLQLYKGDRPLFNKHNIEEQIERIYKRRVPLPSGGEIVIDGTEALTAVDVNSARSRRGADAEEIATQTNVEAAAEIARQLRLRHQGGLIVIDFIDMSAARNRTKVEKALRDAMKGDRAKYDITKISKLGLVEIARQRIQGEKMSASYATCPVCDGHGLIKNVETAGLAALRKLQTRAARGDAGRIRLALPPDTATWMLNQKRSELLRIEQSHNLQIEIEPRAELRRHETEFEVTPREKGERVREPEAPKAAPAAPSRSRREPRSRTKPTTRKTDEPRPEAEVEVKTETASAAAVPAPESDATTEEKTEAAPANAEAAAESGEGRPRRRRRRRRRGRASTGQDGESGEGRASEGSEPQATRTRASGEPDGNPAPPRKAPAEESQPIVPKGVRSDELMPAAVGTSDRGKRKGQAPAGRRRKKAASGGRGRARRSDASD
jgi:ribonuclease E